MEEDEPDIQLQLTHLTAANLHLKGLLTLDVSSIYHMSSALLVERLTNGDVQ